MIFLNYLNECSNFNIKRLRRSYVRTLNRIPMLTDGRKRLHHRYAIHTPLASCFITYNNTMPH